MKIIEVVLTLEIPILYYIYYCIYIGANKSEKQFLHMIYSRQS